MFYNPNFQFDEIDRIQIPDNIFETNEYEDQYPVDTEHLEPAKPSHSRKSRRNLSKSFLHKIQKSFQNLKILKSTKIGIVEQNENEIVDICIDDSDYNTRNIMHSHRILPGPHTLKDCSNVTIRKKQGKQSSSRQSQELNRYYNFEGNQKATIAAYEDEVLYAHDYDCDEEKN
jgi:hypothetical protein